MECDACRGAVPAGSRFCPNCAAPVRAGSSPASSDPLRAALENAIGFQYRIERLLGRGGMGAVYLAHELALDRPVAIKVLPPERSGSEDLRERFRREARTAARLNHPNIVPLHTFGEVSGLVYFVMGYVKGESLAARVRRLGKLDVEEARRILLEVLDALDYAHRQGVVHRDIKPDNILLDEDSGRPLLTDFGIAKAAQAGTTLTGTGQLVGTPHYMSPEQASGKADVDARSDLYSLGVMAYEMLSGRRPFEGQTPGDVLAKHLTQEPPPLETVAKGVPASLLAPLARCLAKDPDKRWPDALSLKRALAAQSPGLEEPTELRVLRGAAQTAVIAALTQAYVALLRAIDPQWEVPWLLESVTERPLLVHAAFVLIGGGAALDLRKRHGMGWTGLLRAAFSQPVWWLGWYPRSLRRPRDLWHRLPPAVRRLRNAAGLALGLTLCLFLFGGALSFSDYHYARTGERTVLGRTFGRSPVPRKLRMVLVVSPMAVLGGYIIVEVLRLSASLRRTVGSQLADRSQADRALFEPSFHTGFWTQPPYAALLAPEEVEGPSSLETLTSPDEIRRSVARLVEDLPRELRELGEAAVSAARELCASIRELDAEISALAKDGDPEEARRLEARLSALGDGSQSEPESRRQMRELLDRQLGLVRGLLARLEESSRLRNRRFEILRQLRLEVAALRAEAARAAVTSGTTARVRALCEEIVRRAEDLSPTAELTRTRGPANGAERHEDA